MIETLPLTIIRKGVLEDIEEVLGLIEEFYEESLKGYGLSFSCETLRNTINNFIVNQIGLVAEKDGKIIGCIGGIVVPSIFDNKEKIAQEAIWYVKKEERKGAVGIRLLKEFEKECILRGAKFISMIYEENLLAEELKNFYEKSGYKLMENHFIKGV